MTLISYTFDPSIIRAYDIRGMYGTTLTDTDAYVLGRCFGAYIATQGGKGIALGQDNRLSSPALAARLIQGLLEAGIDIMDIGVGPSPLLYYAVQTLEVAGGIMITGSHNEPCYNGFKLSLKDRPFFGEDIQALSRMATMLPSLSPHPGAHDAVDVREAYIHRLVQDTLPSRPLRVVWDVGNGAVATLIYALTEKLSGEHFILFGDSDGRYPHHHPDPSVPENMEDLRRAVFTHTADMGIAFDGDGDRIGVVDDKGRVLQGDQLLILLAQDLLRTRPGSTIITDVKASLAVSHVLEPLGGAVVLSPTGHSIIKTKMKELHAPLAGEMSGHVFFADHYYGYDDALYAAIRLLNIVGNSSHSLSAAYDALPQYYNTPELRIECSDEVKFLMIERIKKALDRHTVQHILDVDGLRITTDDGWWLIRASNTQGALIVRCESPTPEGFKRLLSQVKGILETQGLKM